MKHKKTANRRIDNRAKSHPHISSDSYPWTNIMVLFIFSSITIIYAFLAYYTISNVGITTDEGFYLMAAKKVMSGYLPYYDFGYTQTPILPYINGVLLKIFGFEQQTQRIINMCWGYLAVIASMIFVLKWRGVSACFICGWVLLSSPYWVGQNFIGTYGVTNLLMTLTGVVFFSPLKYNYKVVLFSILGILAIACRLTVAPSIGIMWAIIIFEGNGYRQRLTAIITFIAVGLILFLPFFLASPENFIFWNIGYHLICTVHRRIFYEHILASPSIFIMISFAIPLAFILKKKLVSHEVVLLLAATAGIISQMVPKASYACYSMLFSTIGVMGGSIILSDFKWKKYIYGLLLIFPLVYMTPLNPYNYLPLPIQVFLDASWNETLSDAKTFLKEHTQADDLLLTPFPVIAIEADRSVFHGMEMGIFTLTDEMDQTSARKLNFMSYNELINVVEHRKAKAIILNNGSLSGLNFATSMPSFTPVNHNKVDLLFNSMERNYRVVYVRKPIVIIMAKE